MRIFSGRIPKKSKCEEKVAQSKELRRNLTSKRNKSPILTEAQLIEACRKGDQRAQKALYERYAPHMLGVCLRYVRQREQAEDLLVEGMYKVLTRLRQYSGQGSFEGWIRRVMVNECLMYLRKNRPLKVSLDERSVPLPTPARADEQLLENDILHLLDGLPLGYRTVFNLYVIEGYKHREIADLLGISINTSKSQLLLARKRMQEQLKARGLAGGREN